MKKVSIIEFFKIIKNDFKTFFCVEFICTIAVAFFLGLTWLNFTLNQNAVSINAGS
ncbi:MAG: hypothetical protein MJ072_01795 [Clostridia bacterium]|nr:hypothetical protein [Clostridia bacterium]